MKWFQYIFIVVLVGGIIGVTLLAISDIRAERQIQEVYASEDLGHGLRRTIDHDNCMICYSQSGGGFASVEVDCVPLPGCTPVAAH